MMTPAQKSALEGLVGRALTAGEVSAIEPHLAARNDVAIASVLSVGRKKHGPTQIGTGTIVVVLGDPRSGLFLDALAALGETDRTTYWGMDPVRRGVLDLSVPATPPLLNGLKNKMEGFNADIDKILMVGMVDDPIPYELVSKKLNEVAV